MGHLGNIDRLDGFAVRLSRALRRLSMCSQQVSVFAVSVPGLESGALYRDLKRTMFDAYEIGQIDPDTVGVLYYGPRPAPGSSDTKIADMLARDLARIIFDALSERAVVGLRLRTLHLLSAQIMDTPDIMAALACAPAFVVPLATESVAA